MALSKLFLPVFSLLLLQLVSAVIDETNCATTCHELNCDSANIRYGKFCGIGHGGCPGVQPCDAVDACCRRHDACVEKKGVLNANSCHEKFIKCLNKQEAKGGNGFSSQCPWSLVIPTMRSGIEMAMAFTSMFAGQDGGSRLEL